MRKIRTTALIKMRLIPIVLAFYLIFSFFSSSAAIPAAGPGRPEEKIRQSLLAQHRDLLIEKAVCDEKGREIDGRIGMLIQAARAKGLTEDRQVLEAVLLELNYTPSNLGDFPACAFDRPIGHTLEWYGKTVAPGNIQAQAEGNACPAGGIGAGSFEWTMSGHFRYWFLKSGWLVDDTVWADQFHVFMKQENRIIAQTLSTDSPTPGSLQSWKWGYPAGQGSYYALFPKSGFSYERNDLFPVKLAVTQLSPVIPHNYRETSYPVVVYKWIAENPSSEPAEVSVMLTWQNMIGWEAAPKPGSAAFTWERKSENNRNAFVEDGHMKGIVFQKRGADLKKGNAMTGSMSIAAAEVPGKAVVFYHTDFDSSEDGSEVWDSFSADGTLSNTTASRTASARDELAAAIAVKVSLAPREKVEFPIVIAWDFPYYEFEKGVKYRKKYTDFFGATGDRAFAIAAEALTKHKDWEKIIDDWQAPILADPRLPGWLKQALFNELYILAETSIWDAATGLHTYLESADYLMYGTFDVDSYCWHILKLWPDLELDNVRFFARSVVPCI